MRWVNAEIDKRTVCPESGQYGLHSCSYLWNEERQKWSKKREDTRGMNEFGKVPAAGSEMRSDTK